MTRLRRLVWIGLLALAGAGEAAAQAWQARYNMTSSAFQREFDELKQNGFSPVEINALEVDGEIRFDAVWRQEVTEAWQSWHGMSAAGLQEKFNQFNRQGLVPTVLVGYRTREGVRFAAIWRRDPGVVYEAEWNMDAARLQQRADDAVRRGYVPATISGYGTGDGQTRYAATWRRRSGVTWESRSDLTESAYQAYFDRLTPQGYVPVDVSVYRVGGETRFAAIWERISGTAWEARHHMSLAQYAAFTRGQATQGYVPYAIASYPRASGVSYAGFWRLNPQPVVRADPDATRNLGHVPPGARSARLDVRPVFQQTQVWCWLAVGEMLFRYYGIPNVNPAGNFQCGIIGRISDPRSPCAAQCGLCVRPSGSNHGTLSMVATYAQLVAQRRFQYTEARVISPTEIMQNIDARRPIMAGVSTNRRIYDADSEHVVLIVGYETAGGGMNLIVNDPFPYAANGNPYLRYGGTQLQPYQYRISYRQFQEGLFWHWSVFNLSLS